MDHVQSETTSAPLYELLEECFFSLNSAKSVLREIKHGSASQEIQELDLSNRYSMNQYASMPITQRQGFLPKQMSCVEVEKGCVTKVEANIKETTNFKPAKAHPEMHLSRRERVEGKQGETQNQNNPEIWISPESILKDFANQVAKWRASERTDPGPKQFAKHLIDQFLVKELARLPKSASSTIARKAISLEIEKISKMQPGKTIQPGKSNIGIKLPPKKVIIPVQSNNRPEKPEKPPQESHPSPLYSEGRCENKSRLDQLLAKLESQESFLQSFRSQSY